jgi:hypothetical protein
MKNEIYFRSRKMCEIYKILSTSFEKMRGHSRHSILESGHLDPPRGTQVLRQSAVWEPLV